MTLGSVQTPDNATLESYGKNLVDWYSSYLISIQEHLKRISGTVVCDAFFSKATFIKPLCENGFHVISRFRNDAVLFYPTLENRTGKRGRPKLYDGKIDFENLDITRCTEYKVNKGKLYGLKNLAKAACKKMGIKYSISSCKSVIHNAYMLERFICVSGIEPNTQLIDKLFKELILFTAKAA